MRDAVVAAHALCTLVQIEPAPILPKPACAVLYAAKRACLKQALHLKQILQKSSYLKRLVKVPFEL